MTKQLPSFRLHHTWQSCCIEVEHFHTCLTCLPHQSSSGDQTDARSCHRAWRRSGASGSLYILNEALSHKTLSANIFLRRLELFMHETKRHILGVQSFKLMSFHKADRLSLQTHSVLMYAVHSSPSFQHTHTHHTANWTEPSWISAQMK